MKTMQTRLNRLERVQADRELPEASLVAIPTEDGFSVTGQNFDTVEAVQTAYPDRTGPLVLVRVVDGSRPQEVDHDAA